MLQLKLKLLGGLNPAPIMRAVARAERQVLTRAGARVRGMARALMRRRKRASRPGEAPTVRKGTLKQFILFAYEPEKHTTVIGPKKLPNAWPDTAEALERGKTTVRVVGRRKERRRKAVKFEPRPAMQPALDKMAPLLPAMWRGAVK